MFSITKMKLPMYFAYTCNYHCCCMHTVDLFSVTKIINHSQSFSKGTKPSLREVGWLNFHMHLAYLTLL